MFEQPDPELEARDLWGVRAAVLMVALVGLEFLVFDFLSLDLLLRDKDHRFSSLLFLLLSAVLTAASWKTMTGLLNGRRYAAVSASLHGCCYLFFCGAFTYDLYHPEHSIPDEGFGLLMVPFMLPFGLWLLVYPHLPHVRRIFAADRQAQP